MTARWPDTLPAPQADTMEYDGANFVDVIDVLSGPTRTRLARRHASGSYQLAIWMSAAQTEAFETWYNDVIANHDGEWYAPWIGHGAVLAFVNEYDLKPQGRGWTLGAVLAQLRTDTTLCDEHLSEIFGGILRDPGNVIDNYLADLTSTDIFRDDYPLSLIASEGCWMATDYELWATQHGNIDAQPVQVLEFIHTKWGEVGFPGSLWLSDYGEPFTATTEEDIEFTAEPVGFAVELPKQSNSTQSEMLLRLDALGGYVMSQVRAMTDEERTESIRVVWRLFLDTDRAAPQLDPLGFVVTNISATRLMVEFQCTVSALPNIAPGTRYTIDKFPSLAYL